MNSSVPGRPSPRWPLAGFLAMGIFWGTWAALLPDIKMRVGASDAEFGLALLGAGVGALPAMLLTGRLWRRLGWWLLPATLFAFGLAAITPLLASTPAALAGALVLIGAASGSLDVAMNAGISDVEVAANRKLMYGAHALFSLGVLVGSVVTGLVRGAGAGPNEVLPLVTLAMVLVGVGSITAARRMATAATPQEVDSSASFSAIRALAALAALCALAFLIEDAMQNWSALHLERELLAGPVIGGAAPGIFAGAMFAGRSAGQWLGGRYSDRALLVGGGLGACLGLAVVAAAPSALIALAGLAVAGAGVALVAPALFARAGRTATARGRGAAMATLTFFGYTGFLLGPVLVGQVSQVAGLRSAIGLLGVLALVLAAAGWLVLRIRRAGTFTQGEELLRTSRG